MSLLSVPDKILDVGQNGLPDGFPPHLPTRGKKLVASEQISWKGTSRGKSRLLASPTVTPCQLFLFPFKGWLLLKVPQQAGWMKKPQTQPGLEER